VSFAILKSGHRGKSNVVTIKTYLKLDEAPVERWQVQK
jgi:hypothetical protein